ncbi:cytochrome o ubiquinol oxidase subunit I, partial [Sodalis-like endosymbiont of Proechinophthirus fluctus]
SALIALGILCQVIQIVVSMRDREKNRDLTGDPWGGRTLEWATSSPPPFYNFAIVPKVNNQRDIFWQMKEEGTAYQKPLAYEPIRMPKNTGAGVIIATFILVFSFALIWHIWWLAIVGFAGMIMTWIVHSFNEDVDYYVPVGEVERIENRHFDQINEAGVKNVN